MTPNARYFVSFFVASLFATASVGCGGCGDPDPGPTDSGSDAAGDAAPIDDAEGDVPESDMPPDMPRAMGRVEIDLDPYLGDSPFDDGGTVRVFQAEQESDLVEGPVASGRVGDWVLENEVARFVVEGDVRAMSPCPFGGHLIDASATDLPNDGDSLGEICLFVNAGSTLVPEEFEVLQDGSDGGAGVLAVSGPLHLLDWINFTTAAADLGFGAIGELAIGPNTIPPVHVTTYFILRPGERGVRVVTAMRNDGDAQVDLAPGHMMSSGGDGYVWNPLSTRQGYGTSGLSVTTLQGEPMPWIGYGGGANSSWAYVPEPNPDLDEHAIPIGGTYLYVSGVLVAMPDIPNILQLMIATPAQVPTLPTLVHLQPGEIATKGHWMFAGDGSMSTMTDQIYTLNGVATGTVTGVVQTAAGDPAEGAFVTAIDPNGNPLAQSRTDASGAFQMNAPVGSYEVRARVGNLAATPVDVDIAEGASEDLGTFALPEPATFVVHIRNPAGEPVPGRVTVTCDPDDGCPGRPTSQEMDLTTDRLPETWAGVHYADVGSGDVEFRLPPGPYRVVVSRGMAWSVWPEGAVPDGGFEVDAQAGQTYELDAEIAPVVDMTGLVSSDLHVHTMASHDSGTPRRDRIHGFVADGLDVAVSSDHDIIVDYGPAAEALGATDEIATVVGLEISNSEIHYNGFPLEFDPNDKRGGALDWGSGLDLSMTPAEIMAWVDDHPGEQVVQVNHADSLGMFKTIEADPLRGISLRDPEVLRLPPTEPDPATGDTGLWTEAFTAFEVANGNDLPQFWALFRWWLTMVGRGFSPTGTAVTDTHRRFSYVGTTPRTVVSVPEGSDTAATFDVATFVDGLNGGRAFGTNGPVLRVTLRNDADERAGMGDVLDGSSGEVTAEVEIQSAEWIEVDTIDVYTNVESVVGEPGRPVEDPVPPTQSVPVTIQPTDIVDVANGAARTHRRIQKTVEIPLTVTEDSYFVFIVRGETAGPMTPVLRDAEILPFSWTNPIFVDFDGNGYDNPPLADLASTMPPPPPEPAAPVDTRLTEQSVLHSLQRNTCTEAGHSH